MRVVVVGLGIQGRKRLAVAGDDVVATIDPVVPSARYRSIEAVPLETYDAALVCTPDEPKEPLLAYLLRNGKHVLVEKPLLVKRLDAIDRLDALAERTGAVCYTAYNHRFEPHLATVKRLLDEGTVGGVYQARFFYGNGTARDVRNSPWRDTGLGVIPDLASHLLDLILFMFGEPVGTPHVWAHERFENRACDYFLMGFPGMRPLLTLEGTLLSWRNTFQLDVVGETGSLHVRGLCKWGPASLIVRRRTLPSGVPAEDVQTLEQKDPTWALEYAHFQNLCANGAGGNLANDRYINRTLQAVATQVGVELLAS
jgi:predicted dehydrogenase